VRKNGVKKTTFGFSNFAALSGCQLCLTFCTFVYYYNTFMKNALFFCIVISLLLPAYSAGESPWVLLLEEDSGKYQIYYNRESIKKIDGDTLEVHDVTAKPDLNTHRQLRINCRTRQYAIGQTELYSAGAETPYQTFDFSKQGWMWFTPGDDTIKKLVMILCDGKRQPVR
jgi:hypothetical protein